MPGESILVIEDDPTMLRVLSDNLKYQGYNVRAVADGEKGLEAALESKPDLILLDIMLPKVNGYEICRLVRQEGLDVPIIMLTAKGQESDITLGLNLGADDYVTKPFSIKVLLARVNAFLRRRREEAPQRHTFGEFELDLSSHKLTRGGQDVPLTPKEFGLLAFFAARAGRALTRDQILRAVWGYSVFVTPRSVDRCINTLREKVEEDPDNPVFIKSIRGVGYRFDVTPESDASS
jgi:two-component system response regulator VicR